MKCVQYNLWGHSVNACLHVLLNFCIAYVLIFLSLLTGSPNKRRMKISHQVTTSEGALDTALDLHGKGFYISNMSAE